MPTPCFRVVFPGCPPPLRVQVPVDGPGHVKAPLITPRPNQKQRRRRGSGRPSGNVATSARGRPRHRRRRSGPSTAGTQRGRGPNGGASGRPTRGRPTAKSQTEAARGEVRAGRPTRAPRTRGAEKRGGPRAAPPAPQRQRSLLSPKANTNTDTFSPGRWGHGGDTVGTRWGHGLARWGHSGDTAGTQWGHGGDTGRHGFRAGIRKSQLSKLEM